MNKESLKLNFKSILGIDNVKVKQLNNSNSPIDFKFIVNGKEYENYLQIFKSLNHIKEKAIENVEDDIKRVFCFGKKEKANDKYGYCSGGISILGVYDYRLNLDDVISSFFEKNKFIKNVIVYYNYKRLEHIGDTYKAIVKLGFAFE